MKHKHAELIKAWADGAEIQVYSTHHQGWIAAYSPKWEEDLEYRIKPKQPVVRWKWAYERNNGWCESERFWTDEESGGQSDHYIKLEYTRTEFPE